MFLNNLSNEQKAQFLELAIKAAESNGIVALEQKNMLKCFAIEMNITPVYRTDRNLEDIINGLVQISSEKELRIILFEVLGIIISDTVFDDSEKEFVRHMVERCNMDSGLIDKMIDLLNVYSNVYQEIVNVVL